MENSANLFRILILWNNKSEQEKKQILDIIIVSLQCQEALRLPPDEFHRSHLKG